MGELTPFPLFVETIHVFVSRTMSQGAVTVLISEVPPGGGPPPHTHTREDETFTALEGDFELLVDGNWVRIPVGVPVFAPRGHRHTFRNGGSTAGRLLIVAAPGGIEEFLEQLSKLSPSTQMPEMKALAERYGITLG
jgi:quercetin dioxygenase-like cupin family protein